jgi:epoxyqueuosine reductase
MLLLGDWGRLFIPQPFQNVMMLASYSFSEKLKQLAYEQGFDLAGIAPVRNFAELEYFPRWIAAGHAGEMRYLEARDDEGELKRSSLNRVAPWARSVIVCAINYNTAEPYSTQVKDKERGWISRYAWSREDYHESVLRRLRAVEARLVESVWEGRQDAARTAGEPSGLRLSREASTPVEVVDDRTMSAAQSGTERTGPMVGSKDNGPPAVEPALQTRCYVDTGPLIERVYAKYAGVGWIGKNTCILNQKMGSWLFLGVILTSLELTPDIPAPDRCGTCTRCLDACPTSAFNGPYQLDSNKCISYLTIEKRGAIPDKLGEGIGHNVFGCDICQDVCPWNRQAPITGAAEFQPREGLVNPALEWLAEMEAEEFRNVFRRSPIRRTKLSGLRRNAIIAMGNSGNSKFISTLETLCKDGDAVVAESAKWALQRLSGTDGEQERQGPVC